MPLPSMPVPAQGNHVQPFTRFRAEWSTLLVSAGCAGPLALVLSIGLHLDSE